MSEFAFLKSDGTGCRATCSDADARLVVSDGYYASGTTLDKPDAIDLGKRLLEHFDVLPTKPELHCVILALDSFMDVCEEYGAMMPGTENRTKIDATIAKLRRLAGEEG